MKKFTTLLRQQTGSAAFAISTFVAIVAAGLVTYMQQAMDTNSRYIIQKMNEEKKDSSLTNALASLKTIMNSDLYFGSIPPEIVPFCMLVDEKFNPTDDITNFKKVFQLLSPITDLISPYDQPPIPPGNNPDVVIHNRSIWFICQWLNVEKTKGVITGFYYNVNDQLAPKQMGSIHFEANNNCTYQKAVGSLASVPIGTAGATAVIFNAGTGKNTRTNLNTDDDSCATANTNELNLTPGSVENVYRNDVIQTENQNIAHALIKFKKLTDGNHSFDFSMLMGPATKVIINNYELKEDNTVHLSVTLQEGYVRFIINNSFPAPHWAIKLGNESVIASPTAGTPSVHDFLVHTSIDPTLLGDKMQGFNRFDIVTLYRGKIQMMDKSMTVVSKNIFNDGIFNPNLNINANQWGNFGIYASLGRRFLADIKTLSIANTVALPLTTPHIKYFYKHILSTNTIMAPILGEIVDQSNSVFALAANPSYPAKDAPAAVNLVTKYFNQVKAVLIQGYFFEELRGVLEIASSNPNPLWRTVLVPESSVFQMGGIPYTKACDCSSPQVIDLVNNETCDELNSAKCAEANSYQ